MVWALFVALLPMIVYAEASESVCQNGDMHCEVTSEAQAQAEAEESLYTPLPLCEDAPETLGPYTVNVDVRDLSAVLSSHREVMAGGTWAPHGCTPRQKVAVVVPYRQREKDLPVFLAALHPFLQTQRAQYTIYIINQADDKHFNRGSLLNIGYNEAMDDEDYDCIILHDVDKWPEDTRNLYRCNPGVAVHMIGRQRHVGKDYRKRPYETYFGGVTAISSQDFAKINGFSNFFWGWGSEDDDLLNRMKHHHMVTERVEDIVGSYVESYQPYGFVNPRRHDVVQEGKTRYGTDGINSVQYAVLEESREPLYTNISVHLLHEDPYHVKP